MGNVCNDYHKPSETKFSNVVIDKISIGHTPIPKSNKSFSHMDDSKMFNPIANQSTLSLRSVADESTFSLRSAANRSTVSLRSAANQSTLSLRSSCILSPISSVGSPISMSAPSVHSVHSDNKAVPQKRKSSLLNVQNGITGKFISSRICKIAAIFWSENIENMCMKQQLEVGCSIFFGILSNKEMKSIVKTNFQQNVESSSVKLMDMMGWLIRHLITDKIDLYSLLLKLGLFHSTLGIKINHYSIMLKSLHETMSYYFPTKYNIEVKYSMDEIFSLTAQLMTGQDLKFNAHLNDITKQFQSENIPFLTNLETCLKSNIGQDYLYRYFSQTYCDEISIFLQTLKKFKALMTDKERYFVARNITNVSIDQNATFSLNLSYDTRNNAMARMMEKTENFLNNDELIIAANFFSEVECELYKLILQNHWRGFCDQIKTLQMKSFNVE